MVYTDGKNTSRVIDTINQIWKRYRSSSFFTLMMKKLHFSLENKCKLLYYTVNALIWKSNSLRFSLTIFSTKQYLSRLKRSELLFHINALAV